MTTQPTNSNKYTFPDGTIVDFGNRDPQKCLDDYAEWRARGEGTSAKDNSIDSELKLDCSDLSHEQIMKVLKWHNAIVQTSYVSRKEIEEALRDEEYQMDKHRPSNEPDVMYKNELRAELRAKLLGGNDG